MKKKYDVITKTENTIKLLLKRSLGEMKIWKKQKKPREIISKGKAKKRSKIAWNTYEQKYCR